MYKLVLCILILQWAEFVFYYFTCLLLGIELVRTLLNSFHLSVMVTKMQFVSPNTEDCEGVLLSHFYRK